MRPTGTGRSRGEILPAASRAARLEGDLFRRELGCSRAAAEFRARRKPRLLFRFDGSFLLRFADRQFLAVLFQLPPRLTRFEPHGSPTAPVLSTASRNRQLRVPADFANADTASSRI